MYIRIGYDISFDVPATTSFLMLLRVHPSVEPELVRPEVPTIGPGLAVTEHLDEFGNRAMRVLVPPGRLRLTNDAVVKVDGLPDPVVPDAVQHWVSDLPDDVLPFLLASRYCEVDRLGDVAWSVVSAAPMGWARVQAICDWVNHHLTFDTTYARPTKTAFDAYAEARGVCRDFAHLAITLCRCVNIPARYATGYLGDIGVEVVPYPMDFSAWFEVYLSGRWHTFDARHNIPRIGRVVMARGRDAVDGALTTAFGSPFLASFQVWTDEVSEPALVE